MKVEIIRRLLGGAACIFGVYWLWSVFVIPLFSLGEQGVDLWFIATILSVMGAPGILAVIFGFRLFNNETVINVKAVVGIFSAIGVMFLASFLKQMVPELTTESYVRDLCTLIGIIVGISVYLFSVLFLLRCLNLGNGKSNTTVEKVLLVLIALRLWLFISRIMDYLPGEEDYMMEPWYIPLLIVQIVFPIVIPIYFYKLMLGWIERRQSEQGSGQQPPASPELKAE